MILTSDDIKKYIESEILVFTPDGGVRKPLIEGHDPDQMQFMDGGAYDLRVAEVRVMPLPDYNKLSGLFIGKSERRTQRFAPATVEEWMENGYWLIDKGPYYLLTTTEIINMPAFLRGQVESRTTLFRCGLHLLTSDVSPNYQGTLTFGLTNVGPWPVNLEPGARIASITFQRCLAGWQSINRRRD